MPKRKPKFYIFALYRSYYSRITDKWYPTANSGGEFYTSLELAQREVELIWMKEPKRNVWRTDRQDIIIRQSVYA